MENSEMKNKISEVNTKEYWNKRFEEGDWEKYDGDIQSRFFAELACKMFPLFLQMDLQKNNWTVQDIGCAEGGGTAYLAKHFPACRFVGMDFSDAAIAKASQHYPQCRFEVADVYQELPKADVIFSSNMLEHLKDVHSVFSKLCNLSTKYTILLLPFEDESDIDEHINRFEDSFFPLVVGQAYLEYCETVDCDSPYWKGKQILLVYTNSEYRPNRMTVRDMKMSFQKQIEDAQNKLGEEQKVVLSLQAENVRLSEVCEKRQTEITIQAQRYEQKIVASEQEIADLKQKLTEQAEEYEQKIVESEQRGAGLEREIHRTSVMNESLTLEKQRMCSQIRFIAEDSLQSRPYRMAYFFHRFAQQGIRAPRTERKKFRLWLHSKLLHKEAETDYQYNPFRRIQYILDNGNTSTNEVSQPAVVISPSSHINRTLIQERIQKSTPGLKPGRYLEWIVSEECWIEELDTNCVDITSVSILQSIFNNSDSYKGIVVYPATIPWEPFQTPQQLLVAFVAEGYLCVFCEKSGCDHKGIYLLQKNIWAIPEDIFLKAIGNKQVLVMLTWMGSVPFVEHIPNKKVWYHVLDQLDIFSLYDDSYLVMHNKVVQSADWVSYVAKPLLKCIDGREDAIYLPNACHAEELILTSSGEVPEDLKPVVDTGHPIIGYFGWIAEWMDYDLVDKVAKQRPNYEFVMIGPMDESKDVVSKGIEKLRKNLNVHFLGRKKYEELPSYARRFQVGTVPFLINEMMDCVSPIKFYEYCAYGIPTITSYMPEMENYSCEYVRCYRTSEEYLQLLDEFVGERVQEIAHIEAPKLAMKNTWRARVEIIGGLYSV